MTPTLPPESQQDVPPEEAERRRQLSTLSPKGPLIQAAVLLAGVGVSFWFNHQLTTQRNATEDIDQENQQLKGELASTQETSDGIKKSLATVTTQVESVGANFDAIRNQLQVLKQDYSDRQAKVAVSEANAEEIQHKAKDIPSQIRGYDEMLHERNRLLDEIRKHSDSQSTVWSKTELTLLFNLRQTKHAESSASWRNRLTKLMTPVNQVISKGDRNIEIPQELLSDLERLKAEIQVSSISLETDVNSLKAFAQRFRAPSPPGIGSLEEQFDDFEIAQAAQRNEEVSSRLVEAQRQADDRLEEAGRDTIRRLNDIELAGRKALEDLQAEADELGYSIRIQKARDDIDLEKKAEEWRRQEARLLAEKQETQRQYETALPELKRLLLPFLAAGHQQLDGTTWTDSPTTGPLSYSGIRASGALEPDSAGHQAFLWLAGGPYNDRVNGIFPQYIGGNVAGFSCLPSIRRGQFLLSEFGEILVANDLLAP